MSAIAICADCGGRVELATNLNGACVESCRSCGYSGPARASAPPLKAYAPADEESKRLRRAQYNARRASRGLKAI